MGENDKIYQVGISGSYGGLNLGDEAILHAIVEQLRKSLPVEITVFSRNAEDTIKRHRVERAIAVRDLAAGEVTPAIERLDLLILGGGGILFDAEAPLFLREVTIAHELGVPVMLYAVGAGPLTEGRVQKQVREALNRAAAITVREREAQRILEGLGVSTEISVTADPALLLEPEPIPEGALTKEHLNGGGSLIGMSVREPGPAAPEIEEGFYHKVLADAADYMVDRFKADVVFVPMERRMRDMQHAHAVISKMLQPQRAWVLKGEYTSGELLSMMKRFDFAVGMRLHFLLFAALQEVPFIALPYSSKVLGFLNTLEIVMPPIELVNAGRLIAYIDRYWDLKGSHKKNIRRSIAGLKKMAMENNRIAVNLLKKRKRAAESPLSA
jgi:polysaccharide pyruvyl transferase CsaB